MIAGQIPHMLTLILVAFICVVMNFAGLELAANQELDWDREFGPGDAIWPEDAPDQTSVVADKSCRTMVLTLVARGWLEENEEGLALKLYRYLLGGRLQVEQRTEEDK